MSSSFDKRWESSKQPSLTTRVKNIVRQPAALKPRLDSAVKRINTQLQRLDQETSRFNERDKTLFNKVVEAYAQHDTQRANIYANELSELRKMAKITMNAKLALDQIVLRLEGLTELGDVAYTLLPVIGVVRDIRNGMASVNPLISRELGDISNILSGIVMDAGSTSGLSINFESANEDARKIMEEAATIAESKMKDTFPELPGKLSIG
jgi:division protein CdvB (Snf7/Vps24/ESCRT-III family)